MSVDSKIWSWINVLVVFAILVIINMISNRLFYQLDLTQDKRFSMTSTTKNILNELDETIFVKVLLDGDFPAGYKRLQSETKYLLSKFTNLNSNVIFKFENPSLGSISHINETRKELAKDGILPVSLRYLEGDGMTNKAIYPYAIFRKGEKKVIINILEPQLQGIAEETRLNNSVSLLEYKFTDAIQKLSLKEKPLIVFTTGHGELVEQQTAALERSLRKYYNTSRVNTDTIVYISQDVNLLIVASPKREIKSKEQFLLDQFIMNGGKIIWLIDYLDVNLDSINKNKYYVPPVRPINLEDMFFNYGFRVQPDLVLDLECTRIPQVIGMSGGKPQVDLIKWPYHPLVATNAIHPISKNLDRVNMYFPSTIDTLKTVYPTKKTILLRSSAYTRFQLTPMRLNFEILRHDMDESKFNKAPRNLAVLVEGEFESAFKNRVSKSTLSMLDQIGTEYKEKSPNTKQLVISDADFIKNLYDTKSKKISPLGYNNWEKRKFQGNENFIHNAIEYMLDEQGVLSSRSKEVKLRMLNRIKAQNEKIKWRMINIVLPLMLLALFAIGFRYVRIKRYTVN